MFHRRLDEGLAMGRNFFNGSDAELYTGSANFSTKLNVKGNQYGLTPEQASAYATMNGAYSAAYQAAIDPETRTKGKIAAKNAAKKSLKVMASDLAKIVEATPTVTVIRWYLPTVMVMRNA